MADHDTTNNETPIDLDAIKEEWIGTEFDLTTFTVERDKMLLWARSVGENDPRFVDPDHDDFQAHPTYSTSLVSRRALPKDFPRLGKNGIDGGKAVENFVPIREGDTLRGAATIAEIYPKTGRSGTMIFVVQRMTFHNQNDEHVANVDWRMIRN